MLDNETVATIRARHPVPWTTHIGAGVVVVLDLSGAQVPLFTITRFVELITQRMAQQSATTQKEVQDVPDPAQ